jgi:pimeloyl-ACP methyl ester carboxylesterase
MYPAGVSHLRVRYVTLSAGLRIRVAESGEKGQPPLLLLHGWGASLYMWRHSFVPLAAAGYHVIAMDLPGHGLSDKPNDAQMYRVESLAAVVRELIEVEGFAEVDVIAQSMAGTIAVDVATADENRVRRLVLVNPACFGNVRLRGFARVVSPSVMDGVLPHLVGRWIVARAHRMVYGDPSRITARDEDEYWAPSQFPGFARAMRMLLHEFRWARPPARVMARRLCTLKERVLVVLGSRDRLVRGAAEYVAALAQAGAPIDMKMVDGGGHAVNEERGEEVAQLALAFLRR